MKKELLLFGILFLTEAVSFFMGIGFVLVMYRLFGPLVRWMWLIGVGWILLITIFSFVPFRDLISRIRE